MFEQELRDKKSYFYNFSDARQYFLILGIILVIVGVVGEIAQGPMILEIISFSWSVLLISSNFCSKLSQKIATSALYLLFFINFSILFSLVPLEHSDWQWMYITNVICLVVLASFLNLFVFLILITLSFFISFLYISFFSHSIYQSDFMSDPETLISLVIPIGSIIFIWRQKHKILLKRNDQSYDVTSTNDTISLQTKLKIAELETALISKTDFLNNISHEIRTPIQGFTALSEGLVTHWNDFSEEKKIDLASQVSANARRLASLVTNLLDLSKFTADKMIMDFYEFNFNTLIEEIIAECKELYLVDKKIEIIFNSSSKGSVVADKNRIEQVLRNLFVNAIKFSNDNSTINVTLELSKINDLDIFHFSISDAGIGIPEAEIGSIFDPFIQSSRAKSKIGTGLGLSISKKIIDAHNGKIWAENNLKVGAKFHFIIPDKQLSQEEIKKVRCTTKILMVDDEDICLSGMELLLANTSYTLIKASSGKEALEYLQNHPNTIDVVLLDLMMPDMYGLTVLEIIKKDPILNKIPVILQSGTSDKLEIQKAHSMGIFSFISKPYKRNIVLAELSKALSYSSHNN